MTSTYLNYKIYANNMAQTLQQTAAQPVVSRDSAYYQQNIGKVKSVSDFVNNYKLFSYAMQAYGLKDMTYAKAFMTKVLQSDPADSKSLVNTLTDQRYKAFAAAFSFTTKGAAADSTATQTTDQENDTLGLYSQNTALGSTAAAAEQQYYKDTIGTVRSLGDLMGNTRLMADVFTAYGLSTSTTSAAAFKAAIESDVSDPHGAANTSGDKGLESLAADFNFAVDGSVTNQRLVQSQTDFTRMSSAYAAQAGAGGAAQAAAKTEGVYVGNIIAKATSIDTLLKDPRVVTYIGKAFGVAALDATTLRKVLTSNVYDQSSLANTMGDAYRQIASAFNFKADGTVARAPAVQAQSKEDISATTNNALNQQIQTAAGAQSKGAQLALYFRQKAASLTNPYQILADSSLLTVVQTALGIPSSSSQADIDVQAKAITSKLTLSDLKNPAKLDKFISQFSALYDINNYSSANDPSSVVNLFKSSDTSSSDSILSLFQRTAASGSILSLFSSSDSSSSTSTSGVLSLFS